MGGYGEVDWVGLVGLLLFCFSVAVVGRLVGGGGGVDLFSGYKPTMI